MKTVSSTTFIYGLLIVVGGVIGYLKASSFPSLIAGSAFGLALFISGFMLRKKESKLGIYIVLFLTFILDAFFTYRFLKSHQFMPAGLMSLLSPIVLIIIVSSLRRKKVLLEKK